VRSPKAPAPPEQEAYGRHYWLSVNRRLNVGNCWRVECFCLQQPRLSSAIRSVDISVSTPSLYRALSSLQNLGLYIAKAVLCRSRTILCSRMIIDALHRIVNHSSVSVFHSEGVIGVLILFGLWSRLAYRAGFLFFRYYVRLHLAAGSDGCGMDHRCWTRSPTRHCWRFAGGLA
jgi:hypothetical protein